MIDKIEKRLKMDDYDRYAVFTPAIINCTITAFIIWCTVADLYPTTWGNRLLAIFGSAAVTAIFARFIMNIFREVSKLFETIHYGRDRLYFPTTSMLLLSDDSISQDLKKRVRRVLKSRFKITMPTKDSEVTNEIEARRTAKDAVALIRKTVANSEDMLTNLKLKRYGQFRNFLGGAALCLPSVITCTVLCAVNSVSCTPLLFIITLIYVIVAFIDYFLTKSAARDYAETLIITFDQINHHEA